MSQNKWLSTQCLYCCSETDKVSDRPLILERQVVFDEHQHLGTFQQQAVMPFGVHVPSRAEEALAGNWRGWSAQVSACDNCTIQKMFVGIRLSRTHHRCIGLSGGSTNAVDHEVWLESEACGPKVSTVYLNCLSCSAKVGFTVYPWIRRWSRRTLTAYSDYTQHQFFPLSAGVAITPCNCITKDAV